MTVKMNEIPTEAQEQRWLVQWMSLNTTIRGHYCKIHNEGIRTPGQTHNLKLMGLRGGVSDLFIYYPTKKFAGLWLEMKRNKQYTPSEKRTKTWLAQEAFQKAVKSVGYEAQTCYGWQDGKRIIENYLLSSNSSILIP